MRWIFIISAGLLNIWSGSLYAQSGNRFSREDYVDMYSSLAMKEMLRSGVPASITLAQGMLESDNGNSSLAKKSNNHFGIKCHNDWTGKKVRHNDDARRECFRKYNSVYDSYVDHSDFLRNTPRYAFLFDLDVTDYKSWAKGLKKAGYATSNTYADMLIRIIEDNDLHRFDLLALKNGLPPGKENLDEHPQVHLASSRKVLENNRIDYVIVREGDTYESIQDEFDQVRNRLYRYNDLNPGDELREGEVLYLQPKRNKAARGNEIHTVQEGETMWDISQEYGVKLDRLYEKNGMSPGSQPEPGDKIYLRHKRTDKLFPLKIEEDKSDEDQIQIEFEDN